MNPEAVEQYHKALREGQRFVKAAQAAGTEPYLPALDAFVNEADVSPVELGVLDPEFTQTHVHRVSEAIQASHPLLSPSPPAHNPSQAQSLFQ